MSIQGLCAEFCLWYGASLLEPKTISEELKFPRVKNNHPLLHLGRHLRQFYSREHLVTEFADLVYVKYEGFYIGKLCMSTCYNVVNWITIYVFAT